jgi:hypothetical protein
MSKRPSLKGQSAGPARLNRLQDRGFYRIMVRGCLDSSWSAWFDGLLLTADCDRNETLISGEVPDQAALHGLLIKVRNLGLPLIAISREESGSAGPAASSDIRQDL